MLINLKNGNCLLSHAHHHFRYRDARFIEFINHKIISIINNRTKMIITSWGTKVQMEIIKKNGSCEI